MRQLLSNFPPRIVSRKWASPAVLGSTLRQRGRDAAFGHHRVRLAEQRFAHHAHLRALRPSASMAARRARAARADHQHVEVVMIESGRLIREPHVVEEPHREAAHVDVGEDHREERDPGEQLWCSFSLVTRPQIPWRVLAAALHEKQSSFPPTRCRQEWQEKV